MASAAAFGTEVALLKKMLLVAAATSALALNTPVAHADPATGDCGFESVQQTDTTGQNYEGVAYGYAVHADGGEVTVRCYVTVNGSEEDSTDPGSGTGVATSAGRVQFAATDTDNVQLCAEVTAHGETTTNCGDSTNTQIPPQEVIDLINSILVLVDPTICQALAAVAGNYGPIVIDGEGDVYLNGVLWYDCPPYVIG